MMMGRKEKLVTVVLAGLLLLDVIFIGARFYIKHTIVAPAYGSSYSEGLVGEPRFINPLLAQSQTDKDLTRLVYAGLYKYDGNGNLIPDLADAPLQISTDEHVYTAKLKPNLKWNDGQAITADDVVFTIQTLQNGDYKSPQKKLWGNITVEKIDDLTVKFTNTTTAAPFITNLTLGILPKHVWAQITPDNFYFAKYNLEPVGSGPYYITEIAKAVNGDINSMKLASYSNYALGKPYIDEVTLKFYSNADDLMSALHTKEVDVMGYVPFENKLFMNPKKTNLTTINIPLYEYQALFFNLNKSKVLGDRDVRTALNQGLNREDFVNSVFSGQAVPAYTPILPGQTGFDPNVAALSKYDPDNANAILDKAGWAKDADGMRAKGGTPLQFTITTNDFELNVKSAENLQKQWQQIGVKANVNVIPTAQLQQDNLRSRNFEALLFAESTGYDPDPFVFWHSSQSADPGFNLAQYHNAAIDKLITDARTNFNADIRAADYQQFQNIFSVDLPAIIVDQTVFVYETRIDIKGMQIKNLASPENRFYDINHWHLQTRRVWK